MATIGEARIEFSADDSKLKSSLSKLENEIKKLDKASFIHFNIDTASSLSKLQALQKQADVIANRKNKIEFTAEARTENFERAVKILSDRRVILKADFELRTSQLELQIDAVAQKIASRKALKLPVDLLERELQNLGKALEILPAKFEKNLATINKQIESTLESNKQFEVQVDLNKANADRQLSALKSRAKELNQEFYSELSDAFDRAGSSVSNFGSKVSGIGRTLSTISLAGLGAIGGALTGISIAGLNSAQDLQKARASFNILTSDVEQGRKTYEDLYQISQATPFDFPEIAQAGKNLFAFGRTAQDVSSDIRVLSDIASSVGTPIDELSLAYAQVAGKGKVMGEELRQLNAKIPANQILAKELGVTMSELAKRVSDGEVPFEVLRVAFEKATLAGGFAFNGTITQTKTLSGQLSILRDNVGQLTRDFVGFNNSGEVVTGGLTDQITKIVNTLNSSGIKEKIGAVLKTIGAEIGKQVGEVNFTQLTKDIGSSLEELNRNLPTIIADVKLALQEFGRDGIQAFKDLANFLKENGPAIKAFIEKLGDGNTATGITKLVAGLVLLGPVLSVVGSALSLIGGTISALSGLVTLAGWFSALLTSVTGATTAFGAFGAIWGGISAGFASAGAVLVSAGSAIVAVIGAIPLAIAAVVIAIVGVGAYFRGGGDILKGFTLLWGDLVWGIEQAITWLVSAGSAIVTWTSDTVASISQWFNTTGAGFNQWGADTWNKIAKWGQDSLASVNQFLTDSISGFNIFFTESLNSIVKWTVDLWNSISTGFINIMNFIQNWWNSLGQDNAERLGFLLGSWIKFLFVDLPNNISNGFNSILITTGVFLANMAFKIAEFTINSVISIGNWTNEMVNRFASFFGETLQRLTSWASQTYSTFVNWGSGVLNTVIGFLSQLPANIYNFLSSTFNNIVNFGNSAIAEASRIGSNVLNGIIAFISQVPANVFNFLSSTLNNIVNFGNSVFSEARRIGSNVLNGISEFMRQIPANVSNFMNDALNRLANFGSALRNTAFNLGKSIVNGIIDGIRSIGSSIANTLGSFTTGLRRGLGFAEGGTIGIPSFATGGSLAGVVPKGDQILSGLRVGEEVINEKSSNLFRPLLKAINDKPKSVSDFFKGTAEIIGSLKAQVGNQASQSNNSYNNSRSVVINYAPKVQESFSYRQMSNMGALINGI